MQAIRAAQIAAFLLPLPASATTHCHATPGSYTDVDGDTVRRPVCATTHQAGETAICNDGSHQLFAPPRRYVFAPRRRRGMGVSFPAGWFGL